MMQPGQITGILIAAIVAWIFGAIYYSLLGKVWMAAQGRTPEEMRAAFKSKSAAARVAPFALSFVAEIIMGLVIYGILTHNGMFFARAGAISGAFCWFGFVLTTIAVNNAYAGRSLRLTAIDAIHWLVVLVIIGAIVGHWGR